MTTETIPLIRAPEREGINLRLIQYVVKGFKFLLQVTFLRNHAWRWSSSDKPKPGLSVGFFLLAQIEFRVENTPYVFINSFEKFNKYFKYSLLALDTTPIFSKSGVLGYRDNIGRYNLLS